MVKKIVDANAFETAQWGVIRLKGVDISWMNPEQKEKAIHRLGELVWRETVKIEVDGREMKSGCEAKVRLGKTDVNEEMKRFLMRL